jgi:phosphatidylglycerophosphate synthase
MKSLSGMNIHLDDALAKITLKNEIWKDVHPNVITAVGIACNFCLFWIICRSDLKQPRSPLLVGLLLSVRYVADILDGAVARKYGKTSRLGHHLDTASDMMCLFVCYFFIIKKLSLSFYLLAIYPLCVISLYKFYDLGTTHAHIKKLNNSQSLPHKLMVFQANNSFLSFFIIYFVYNISFALR